MAIENNSAVATPTKVYEIKLSNKEKIIAKALRVESQNYIYRDKNNQEKAIPKEIVSKIREKKFSWINTIGLTAGGLAVIGVVIAVSKMNINTGDIEMNNLN